MTEQNLTPEQKLDAIYDMLQKQESSRKRVFWFRIFKWMIIFAGIYILMTRSDQIFPSIQQIIEPIVSNLAETMKPMILEQAKMMMNDQIPTVENDELLRQATEILQR